MRSPAGGSGRRGSWAAASLALALASCGSTPTIESTSVLADTSDTTGPYRVEVVLRPAGGTPSVTLRYRVGPASAFTSVTMAPVAGRSNVFAAAIPGQSPGQVVGYFVAASSGGGTAYDPPAASVLDGPCVGCADGVRPDAGTGDRGAVYEFEILAATRCQVDADCQAAFLCSTASHTCEVAAIPCAADADCPTGFACDTFHGGVCILQVRSCSSDFSCLTGEVCDTDLERCVGRPHCGDPCPANFACDTGTGYCIRQCTVDADCGPGSRCKIPEGCVPETPCTTDAQCPSSTCDTTIGGCRGGAGRCADCESDADCGGPHDLCVAGQCAVSCLAGPSTCPTGTTCDQTDTPPQCVPAPGAVCAP